MKKINLIKIILILVFFSSCSRSLLMTQGQSGYSGELEDERYELRETMKAASSSTSVFGFSSGGEIKEDGIINNLTVDGINYNYSQNNFVRALTFLLYSGAFVLAGLSDPTNDKYFPTALGGLVLGGIANNATWTHTSTNAAFRNANLKLIRENPDIDLFIYPKHKIEQTVGIFHNSADVTIFSKGAKLKIDK